MAGYEKGNFVAPTIFSGVKANHKVYTNEIFGPVLVIVSVDTLEEAIEVVNANPFGNGTGIFTQSGAAARKFQNEIDVGQVGINVPSRYPSLPASRACGSKLGDLGPYGKQVIQFYAGEDDHLALVRRRQHQSQHYTTISLKNEDRLHRTGTWATPWPATS